MRKSKVISQTSFKIVRKIGSASFRLKKATIEFWAKKRSCTCSLCFKPCDQPAQSCVARCKTVTRGRILVGRQLRDDFHQLVSRSTEWNSRSNDYFAENAVCSSVSFRDFFLLSLFFVFLQVQHCACMLTGNENVGLWDDDDCSRSREYICTTYIGVFMWPAIGLPFLVLSLFLLLPQNTTLFFLVCLQLNSQTGGHFPVFLFLRKFFARVISLGSSSVGKHCHCPLSFPLFCLWFLNIFWGQVKIGCVWI